MTNVGKGHDVTIKKKLVSGTSAKLYTINVKTKESLDATESSPYTGEYEVYDKDGVEITTKTMAAGVIDLGVDEYIVLKAVAENTVLEITEKVIDENYVRAFHYAYTSVKVGNSAAQTTQTDGGLTSSTNPKKIDNGVTFTVSDNTLVDIYNKPWTYVIKYKYPGYLARYASVTAVNQYYIVNGTFTESDFAEQGIMTIVSTENGPCPKFKGDPNFNEETQLDDVKKFITRKAPYEDNFMTEMTWDPQISSTHTDITYSAIKDDENVLINTEPAIPPPCATPPLDPNVIESVESLSVS